MVARATVRPFAPLGIAEGQRDDLLLAATLNRPDPTGRVLLRCFNCSDQTLKVAAGSIVGELIAVEEADVQDVPNDQPPAGIRAQQGATPDVPSHLVELYAQAGSVLPEPAQRQAVAQLLGEYEAVFSKGDHDVGRTDQVLHEIPLVPGAHPIKQPPHRLGPEKEAEVDRQVQGLLQRGLIEPACGSWSSPVVLVRKKDGTWRFCVDYRRLNSITQYDAYPLPRIDESLDALAGSRYFSTLDLVSGYWQVPMSPDAQEKAIFATRGGLW